jgi:metal-responsive CopG/Arc/MetJ family transcriptional regulator
MKLYRAGEKSKGLCEHCHGIVDATFHYRDVPFNDGSGVVKDILALVCDVCDEVIATPAQSTPAIKAARETAVKSIEVSLPASFVEALDLAAFRIDPEATTEFRKRLLAYYIHRAAESGQPTERMESRIARSGERFDADAPKRRLSFKVTPRLSSEIDKIIERSKLSKSDLIKSLVMQIDEDILQPKSPINMKELRRLAAVSSA